MMVSVEESSVTIYQQYMSSIPFANIVWYHTNGEMCIVLINHFASSKYIIVDTLINGDDEFLEFGSSTLIKKSSIRDPSRKIISATTRKVLLFLIYDLQINSNKNRIDSILQDYINKIRNIINSSYNLRNEIICNYIKEICSKKNSGMMGTQKYNFGNVFINRLNDDCLIHIFQFLRMIDKLHIETVCKRWKKLSRYSWSTITKLGISSFRQGSPGNQKIDKLILLKILQRCGKYLKQIYVAEEKFFHEIKYDIDILDIIFQYCPNLTNIDLSMFTIHLRDLVLLKKKCQKLTKLTIGKSEYLYNEHIFFQGYLQLNYFEICWNRFISGKCLSYLPVQTMNTLIVKYCPAIYDTEFSMGLATLKNLEHLEIRASQIGGQTLEVISNYCKNLKELKIFTSFIHQQNVYKLQFINLVNLQVLQVRGFPFLEEQLISITKNCLQIISLDISGGFYVNDAVIKTVGTLPKLEYLYICNVPITNYGLENIKNLKELNCSRCVNITDEGIYKVLKSSPHLQLLDISHCHQITHDLYKAAEDICNNRCNKVILELYVWGTQIILLQKYTISGLLHTIFYRNVKKCWSNMNK